MLNIQEVKAPIDKHCYSGSGAYLPVLTSGKVPQKKKKERKKERNKKKKQAVFDCMWLLLLSGCMKLNSDII